MCRLRYARYVQHGLFVILLGASAIGAQAASVTMSPTTCVNDTSTGSIAWQSPANAQLSDNSYARVDFPFYMAASNYLKCNNYGFSIPTSARIDGIVVSVERNSNSTNIGGISDTAVRLVKDGAIGTADRSTTTIYPGSDASEDHGGSADLWGQVWTPAYINASNFGAAIAIKNNVTATFSANIDQVKITVYYTPMSCSQPYNTPSNLVLGCQCDTFDRSTLNPSTILNGNWQVANGPQDQTGTYARIANKGYLTLSDQGVNWTAKGAAAPVSLPSIGNYISVEFRHYSYNNNIPGADGSALVFSDASVPLQLGGHGGSLGYKEGYFGSTTPGFGGGWLGVGLDEWGGFAGQGSQAVSVRGSASSGYALFGSTGTLSRGIEAKTLNGVPVNGDFYQVILDLTNSGSKLFVNRDTTGGWSSYNTLFSINSIYNTFTNQANLPNNFRLTFTGATGGAGNAHAVSAVRICALKGLSSSEPTLSGLNVIDGQLTSSSATTGRIYTKLAGTSFNLKVAAINQAQTGVETNYASTLNRGVILDLFDDSVGTSCSSSASACSTCSKPVVSSQYMTFYASDAGFKSSASITIPNAYSRLMVRAKDSGIASCSSDPFSVRPSSLSVSSNATNPLLSGTPTFKAGTDSINLSVSTATSNYSGTPKIDAAGMSANASGWVVGNLNPGQFSAATASSSTVTNTFTYSEAGHFKFLGYDPAVNASAARGIYDDTLTAVDQPGDCIAGSYSNTLDANGKYGCNFGLTADSALFGRFVPDHFNRKSSSFSVANGNFAYMGQAGINIGYTVEACAGATNTTTNGIVNCASVTQNYHAGRVNVVAPTLVAEDQATANQSCNLGGRLSTSASLPSWTNGSYTLPASAYTFSRPANTNTALNATSAANCTATQGAAAGPFDLLDVGLQVPDPEASLLAGDMDMDASSAGTCTAGTNCTAKKLGRTAVRMGRIKVNNAYGSPKLALSMPIEAQYWNGGTFVTNALDSATVLNAPAKTSLAVNATPAGTAGLYFYSGNAVQASATSITNLPTGTLGTLASGKVNLKLSAPNNSGVGFADLLLGVPDYLRANGSNCLGQTGTAGLWDDNPCARATFGIYRSPLVFRRENY